MTEVVETSTPLNPALPGRVRRASAAGRVTAAVAAESFPLTMSPSPLVRPRSPPKHALPIVKRFQFSKPNTPGGAGTQDDANKMTALCQELEAPEPPVFIDYTRRLSPGCLSKIFTFLGSEPPALVTINKICRRWRVASFPNVEEVTLVPGCMTPEKLSEVGMVSTIRDYFNVNSRGQHLKRLSINKPSTVYHLPNSLSGPLLGSHSLSSLTMNLPQLQHLDVRGIQLRDFAPWCDHFLTDLAQHCPKLTSLGVGPQFVRSWEAQWWTPLTHLNRLVIGSRREDHDWNQSSSPSEVQLHEDFFVMLKNLSSLKNLKVWCNLSKESFVQLLFPSSPYPSLTHLAINAQGNTHLKPIEDQAPPEAAAAAPGKKEPKAPKKGAAQQEEAPGARVGFPQLVSIAVADVKERPDFVAELLVRLSTTAPNVINISVVNSHRTGPGKVMPQPTTNRRAAAAAAAAQ